MLCPKCKTHHAGRSHRRGLIETAASFVGYYPYNCRGCHHRFLYKRKSSSEDTGSSHPRVEREIRATRNALKAKRKRRELLLYGAAIVLFLSFLYYITREHGGSSMEGGGFSAPAYSPYAAHSAGIAA